MSTFEFAVDPDRVIHEPARLKIMSVLSVAESADFTYLMRETELTRGNLSVQLSRLEEAGYIAIEKTFVGKTPRTTARMTPEGREAFTAYRAYLERLLDATR
ncbi:MAG TPA: transcriptional regulator [Coriobacteriia bacterium]|nr:MAG: Putative transcriptional regulator, ArsR family [Actinobacteria bacterium 66_15]HAL30848.1 transcriptional regulator [Coriobacteriia bacterium]